MGEGVKIPFCLELACKYGGQDFIVDVICREYRVDKRTARDWLRSLLLLPDSVVILKKIKTQTGPGQGGFIYRVDYVHPDILAYYHADNWEGPVPAVLKNRLNRCRRVAVSPVYPQQAAPVSGAPASSAPLSGPRRSAARRRQDAEDADRARQLWDAMVRCRRALSPEEL